MIAYEGGYLLVEWYGGYSPNKGDVYVGDFHEYGMKTLFCTTSDEETEFWIEDFMADNEKGHEFLYS